MKPTHHHIRRTVGQLLRNAIFFHGADARSILSCQVKRCHAEDSKQKYQHECPEKHVALVALVYEFRCTSFSHFHIPTPLLIEDVSVKP